MEEKRTKVPAQSKRRGLLRQAFWTVAGVVGAGSLLGAKAAPAHASGSEGPTTFTATGGATAVAAQSDSGIAVKGFSDTFVGVAASSSTNSALTATSVSGMGVQAYSSSNRGVYAQSDSGYGLQAVSKSERGVYAQSDSGPGLHAVSNSDIGAILENTSGVAVQVKGQIQVQGNSIGEAILKAWSYSVLVKSPAATPDSLILLTPLDSWDGVLSVSKRGIGSFTINSNTRPLVDARIAYLIVN